MRARRILAIASGDFRLTLKEKSALFWMLVMPTAFVALFGNVFQDHSGPVQLSMAVVDQDNTFASKSFISMLGGERLVMRVLTPAERDTAKGLIRVMTIPRGFEDSLASSRRVTVGIERISGRMQDTDLAAKVAVYKAVLRTLAALAEADSSGEADAAAFQSAGFQSRLGELTRRPDLVRTEVRTAGKGHALPSGFGASASSMLVLFLLMNTVIYGASLLAQEKQSNCLTRIMASPVTHGEIITGKILGRLLIAILQSLILVVGGTLIFHVDWGPSPLALGVVLVSLGLFAAALGILLGGILRTPEQAGAVAWIIPLFLGAIGGTWWPLEIVPRWMQIFGHISPAAWAMDALHGLMAFGKGPSAIVVPCAVLLGGAAALTAIGARILRTD
jgi:ABC-2 type transport system permease protein